MGLLRGPQGTPGLLSEFTGLLSGHQNGFQSLQVFLEASRNFLRLPCTPRFSILPGLPRVLPGLSEFTEFLSSLKFSRLFPRSFYRIPGVSPKILRMALKLPPIFRVCPGLSKWGAQGTPGLLSELTGLLRGHQNGFQSSQVF